MKQNEILESTREDWTASLQYAKNKVAEWALKLAQNPQGAFEWAESASQYAAEVTIYTVALQQIASVKDYRGFCEKVLEHLQYVREGLISGRWISSSTSPWHNAMQLQMHKCYNRFQEHLSHVLESALKAD